MTKTKIIWREWFNESAVKQMTELGTLPREETEIDTLYMDGEEVAAAIAEHSHRRDSEMFREGGELVILEPEEFAGTYQIGVDYEPVFHAYEQD